MTETHDLVVERRVSSPTRRLLWTVLHGHRAARFNRWRKMPRSVTNGFMFFRDAIMIGFVTAIVIAGVSTVRGLRADDCRLTNARREEVQQIFEKLVDNDRNLIEAADALSENGLPDAFKDPLLERYQDQLDDIEAAYQPTPCAGDDR